MRKTYMSVAVSRAMSVEYPVGDPFGGPAFGERNMPVVAIAAGAMGAASLVAAAGTAAGIVGTLGIAGTVAAVGAVVGAVGVITGNKTLTKIGSVMGLVGGAVGAIDAVMGATGTAGSFSAGIDKMFGFDAAADGTFGSLSKGAEAVGNMFSSNTQAAPVTTAPDAVAQSLATSDNIIHGDVVGLIGEGQPLTSATPAQPVTQTAQPLSSATTPLTPTTTGGSSLAVPTVSTDSYVSNIMAPEINLSNSGVTGFNSGDVGMNFMTSPFTQAQQSGGTFDKLMAWANKNPMGAMMALQGVSGAAQLFSPAAQAQAKQTELETQMLKNKMGGVTPITQQANWGLISSLRAPK